VATSPRPRKQRKNPRLARELFRWVSMQTLDVMQRRGTAAARGQLDELLMMQIDAGVTPYLDQWTAPLGQSYALAR
jgi:hypothetical protein